MFVHELLDPWVLFVAGKVDLIATQVNMSIGEQLVELNQDSLNRFVGLLHGRVQRGRQMLPLYSIAIRHIVLVGLIEASDDLCEIWIEANSSRVSWVVKLWYHSDSQSHCIFYNLFDLVS